MIRIQSSIRSCTSLVITICSSIRRNFFEAPFRDVTFLLSCFSSLSVIFSLLIKVSIYNRNVVGTYYDAIVSTNGHGLSDYMLLCSVVATILVIVNTAQVCSFSV